MKNLSLVTARIVRENEQYAYKLVGKGEKYLVEHEEMDNAGMKVIEYLTPFAKEPVKIEQVTLLKNGVEIIDNGDANHIFKVGVEYVSVIDDSEKEVKKSQTYYVQANSLKECFDISAEFLKGFLCDTAITSINRTKIIDFLN